MKSANVFYWPVGGVMVPRIRIECAELMPSDAHFFLSCVKKSTDISPGLQNQKYYDVTNIMYRFYCGFYESDKYSKLMLTNTFLPLVIEKNKHINSRKCMAIFDSTPRIWV